MLSFESLYAAPDMSHMQACSKIIQQRLATEAAQKAGGSMAASENISSLAAQAGALTLQVWLLAHTSSFMQSLAIQSFDACQVVITGAADTRRKVGHYAVLLQHLILLVR